MDAGQALSVLLDLLMTSAMVSAPMLITILVVGLVISILQVATQIQEMTLTYVPKLIGLILVAMLLGSWMLSILVEFTRRMFGNVAGF